MSSLARLSNSMWIAVSCAVFPFSVAQAACSLWDVGGGFKVVQDNGYSPLFTLEQNGTAVSGSASYEKGPAGFVTRGTVVQGSNIQVSNFKVVISWDNATRGVYTGTFDASGKLTGTTFDELHPSSHANWSVNDRRFACLRP
jgi:hypothetical protein